MKKTLLLLTALLFGVFAFQACQKSDDANAEESMITTSEDLATHEDFSEEIDFAADIAIEERGGSSTCPVVTLAQPWGVWPNTITIDYGPDGCPGPNGEHLLKGKIIITQTAEMFAAGAVRTKTFENFYIDDVKVEGTKSWTNNGQDANGLWSYTKTATNMVFSYPDGATSQYSHNHTSTLVQGGNTLTHWDNVWNITGSTTGVNRQGQDFSATITTPLVKRALCRWISEGEITFTRDDRSATLNFGNGACDRFGQLTLDNGNTFTIRLRR